MPSPPPSSAGDTSSADHLLALLSAQIRPPRRVNTQVNELRAFRASEGVTSRVKATLQERRDNSLRERGRLSPRSIVPALDALLGRVLWIM